MRLKVMFLPFLSLILASILSANASAQRPSEPTTVVIGVRLANVEKIDLQSNSYKLDFYLWFIFDPAEISLSDVKAFEFLNGVPSKELIYENETEGFLEYRVKGDFVKTFDFSHYPFESQNLVVSIEHKNMNTTYLVYEVDQDSSIDSGINIVGWDIKKFDLQIVEHRFSGTIFSNFVLNLEVQRPFFSSFIKSVLPVSVITTISLLTFFISPQNFSQRISLGVTTLLSASTFHLALIGGIPSTGYLTFADRMMLSIYIIFLYNLSTSVLIMRLVDSKEIEKAQSLNKKAAKMLLILIIILIAIQLII